VTHDSLLGARASHRDHKKKGKGGNDCTRTTRAELATTWGWTVGKTVVAGDERFYTDPRPSPGKKTWNIAVCFIVGLVAWRSTHGNIREDEQKGRVANAGGKKTAKEDAGRHNGFLVAGTRGEERRTPESKKRAEGGGNKRALRGW